MNKPKTFESWRHTGQLTDREKAVLAAVFSSGGYVPIRSIVQVPDVEVDHSSALGQIELEQRGWLRIRRRRRDHMHVTTTARFERECPELTGREAQAALIAEMAVKAAALAARRTEERRLLERPVAPEIIFVVSGDLAFGQRELKDVNERAEWRAVFDDLAELLLQHDFDDLVPLKRAIRGGDRVAARDAAGEVFARIPTGEILEVIRRHRMTARLNLAPLGDAPTTGHFAH